MELYDALKKYTGTDAYPFHMPGHKRRLGVPGEACEIDITEIDGFDNLHHAEGILKEVQDKAAKLYGAEDTYYLVNGSTAGILASISACVRRGGKLLMARNSHKAAYHAAELCGLRTVYLYPRDNAPHDAFRQEDNAPHDAFRQEDNAPQDVFCQARDNALHDVFRQARDACPRGCILAEDVRAALEQDREIEAVFITSPTYEGIVSDVAEIARAAHSFGVPLIVDEAHGAHFGFHPDFPESSVKLGADLVVHSLHKTLPSMTQTALLHRNGSLVRGSRIQKFLNIYQTSSPSYVLMASMDACIDLLRVKGDTLFSDLLARLKNFYFQAEKLRHFYFLSNSRNSHDISRLVFGAYGHSGKWLADTLRERFSLEMEMAAGTYVVAIATIADTQEGFDRLLCALHTLDEELEVSCGEYLEVLSDMEDMPPSDISHDIDNGTHAMAGCAGSVRHTALDAANSVRHTALNAANSVRHAALDAVDSVRHAALDAVNGVRHTALDPANSMRYVASYTSDSGFLRMEQALTLAEAEECPHRRVVLAESEGQICAEYIYLYPPGIPLIVPGERLSRELLMQLQILRRAGYTLQGMSDYSMETVEIV